ncbi:diptericin-D-like [Condylostylus longicornis]|uniref:diptericin-D-like n=1 Tax=Condylostylus longicornis TaxID=2530218 RepID=UPI00244E49F2|nr:diptericin-D-like [Condylostylus longicornis]
MELKTFSTLTCALLVLVNIEIISAQFNFLQPKPQNNFQSPAHMNIANPPNVFQPPPLQPANNNFKLFGGGGGSPKQGFDVGLGATAKVWESPNGRNQLFGTRTYSQHLGGPYGNSRPNVGGGATFIHKFG